MIKKCYNLVTGIKTLEAITTVTNRIPCFIDAKDCADGTMEFTIQCRAEDVRFVELMLAPFV